MRRQLLGNDQSGRPHRSIAGGEGSSPRGRWVGFQRVYGSALLWSTLACLCLITAVPAGAGPFSNWQYRQEIQIPAGGLIRLELPPEALDAGRPGLEDFRILDPAGVEVPYLIEGISPSGKLTLEVKSFRVSLGRESTTLTLETGQTDPIDGISLTTTAASFIKAAQVEGSADGKRWRRLAQGVPIFRQPGGVSQLRLPVPAGVWPFLRVTVDDRRSPPVAFTQARIEMATRDPVPVAPVALRITERADEDGETRLTLHLTAAHLRLTRLLIDSPDPPSTRRVSLAARQVQDGTIREKMLTEGALHPIAPPGRSASNQLALPLVFTTPSRELLLLIRNEDSPPLQISAIRAERQPVYVNFMARQGGPHAVLIGNRLAQSPRYDLKALGLDLTPAGATALRLSAIGPNPDFRPAEGGPHAAAIGPALDVSGWTYRKRVQTTGEAVQELALDLETLSRALPSLADLRLMSSGRQLPYILEHTSAARALLPQLAPADNPRTPRLSRWVLSLPHRNLPLRRLACTTGTPLFRRELRLYEEATGERGEKQPRQLGRATWVRTPEQQSKELLLTLTSAPTTETLILEANNEDNPPITLERCRLFYPIWRLHFQGVPDTYLYYGNRHAEVPRYDLSLLSTQVLTGERIVASLAAEERIGNDGWLEQGPLKWRGGILLWASLALVVAVLLVIISRLLPRPSPPSER